ncbi:MAG: hypothetical protein BroJett040_19270 [Oligoflexia bacterium]|nr:MAG: hypothetical protein BroJett040_19270 [Oligoflexia bacterium]
MKYKNFDPQVWTKIKVALKEEIARCQSLQVRPVAAFDADGTLWDTDLGEGFFQYQIQKNLLPGLPPNPWRHYRDMKESGDPRPAYLWLAQINKGLHLTQIQKWARDYLQSLHPLPLFAAQQDLIQLLHDNQVDIYIVTASIKWSVEPGAQLYNIPSENVLGVRTKVENGIITETQEGEITYREGKFHALLTATGGRKPFLCAGNTFGDIALLDGATKISLAVGATKPGNELFQAEEKLRAEAFKRNWIVHEF